MIKNIITRYKVKKIIHYIFYLKYIMYKDNEEDCDEKANNKELKYLDTMDSEFYIYLYEINKVFKEKKYKSKIGSKTTADSINQTLIYFNPINGTERFTLNIHNKYSITITVPLKQGNYLYTTTLNDIIDVLKYIKIHI
tara:strand:+ start:1269 stop:1685 length:417 start_codon:yes stop_codon:yes gene_type:complete